MEPAVANPKPDNVLQKRIIALSSLLCVLFLMWLLLSPSPGFDVRWNVGDRETRHAVAPPPFGMKFMEFGAGPATPFRVTYQGMLRARYPGTYHFELGSTGGAVARLLIDGLPMAGANAGSSFPWRGMRELKPGLHAITIEYSHPGDGSPVELSLLWSKDIDAFRRLPDDAVFPSVTRSWHFGLSRALGCMASLAALALALDFLTLRLGLVRARKIRFGLAAMTLGMLFVLVVGEIALRLSGVVPRTYVPGNIWLTYRIHEPGTTTLYKGYLPAQPQEFEVPVVINTVPPRGWRDVERPFAKPPGAIRILVVGDSYVEAKEVPLEKTFHKVFERMLNEKYGGSGRSFEVMALGKGGSATGKQIEFLDNPGEHFSPDWVILALFPGNDIRENDPVLNDAYEKWWRNVYRDKIVPARIAFLDSAVLCQWSYFNHFVADHGVDAFTALLPHLRGDLTSRDMISPDLQIWKAGPYPGEWEAAWRLTEDALLRFQRRVADMKSRFALMLVHSPQVPGADSGRVSKGRGLDLRRPYERLEGFCKSNGIDCLNLAPLFIEASRKTGRPYAWKYDAHWNEYGHELAAGALMERWGGAISAPAHDGP